MSDDRYRVTSEDVLAESDSLIVEVEGREIAIFDAGGEYHAVLNFCVHQSGPLCEGDLIEGRLTGDSSDDEGRVWAYDPDRYAVKCPWHGWEFDIETGENVADERYRVPTYEVEIDDGDVYLRM